MDRRGIPLLAALALGAALPSGCMKIETHVYVQPQGDTEMAFAFRLPAPLAAMLTGAMPQGRAGQGQLPPGVEFSERDEGLEHVWEVRTSGPMNPSRAICKVSKEDRLLSTTYDFAIDPQKANPFGALGLGPGADSLPLEALGIKGLGETDLQSPEGVKEALEGLGGQLGGVTPALENLNLAELMGQVQPALYAHMPGRLTETNGERADDSTARWAFSPETLMAIPAKFTAASELAEMPMIEDIAGRLNLNHGTDATPDDLAGLVHRGLLPNPVVEDREQAVVDLHLYGELVNAAMGLEGLVGADKAKAVMQALDLVQLEPSLSTATKAAKRLPRLRERADLADLSPEEIAAILAGEAQ